MNSNPVGHTFTEFQFHKGTIKTKIGYSKGINGLKFQFHKGTIKTSDLTYVGNVVY